MRQETMMVVSTKRYSFSEASRSTSRDAVNVSAVGGDHPMDSLNGHYRDVKVKEVLLAQASADRILSSCASANDAVHIAVSTYTV